MNISYAEQHRILPKLRTSRKYLKTRKKPLPYSVLASLGTKLPSIYDRDSRADSLSHRPLYRITHYGTRPRQFNAQSTSFYASSISSRVSEEVSKLEQVNIFKKDKRDIDICTSKSSLKVRLPTIRLEA